MSRQMVTDSHHMLSDAECVSTTAMHIWDAYDFCLTNLVDKAFWKLLASRSIGYVPSQPTFHPSCLIYLLLISRCCHYLRLHSVAFEGIGVQLIVKNEKGSGLGLIIQAVLKFLWRYWRKSHKVSVHSLNNRDSKCRSPYISHKYIAWATSLDFSLCFRDLILE